MLQHSSQSLRRGAAPLPQLRKAVSMARAMRQYLGFSLERIETVCVNQENFRNATVLPQLNEYP